MCHTIFKFKVRFDSFETIRLYRSSCNTTRSIASLDRFIKYQCNSLLCISSLTDVGPIYVRNTLLSTRTPIKSEYSHHVLQIARDNTGRSLSVSPATFLGNNSETPGMDDKLCTNFTMIDGFHGCQQSIHNLVIDPSSWHARLMSVGIEVWFHTGPEVLFARRQPLGLQQVANLL